MLKLIRMIVGNITIPDTLYKKAIDDREPEYWASCEAIESPCMCGYSMGLYEPFDHLRCCGCSYNTGLFESFEAYRWNYREYRQSFWGVWLPSGSYASSTAPITDSVYVKDIIKVPTNPIAKAFKDYFKK